MKHSPWWYKLILGCAILNLVYVTISAITGVPVLGIGRTLSAYTMGPIPSMVIIPLYLFIAWELLQWKYIGALLGGAFSLPFAIGALITIFVSLIQGNALIRSTATLQDVVGLFAGIGSVVMAILLGLHHEEYS